MNKALLLTLSCIFLTACSPGSSDLTVPDKGADNTSQSTEEPIPSSQDSETIVQPTEFSAQFAITTNGTKRIFTDKKYHNLSAEVYIESANPSVVQVKNPEATWNDFFATLPMSLNKDCLVTGTGQTFCTNETSELKFWLNGEEVPNALEQAIQPDAFLQVEYRPRSLE